MSKHGLRGRERPEGGGIHAALPVTEPGRITPETVTRAMRAMWDAPYPTPRIVVAPDEADWIKNPVGPAPTALAVDLALGFGTIDADHPDVRGLMAILNGESHLIGDREWT